VPPPAGWTGAPLRSLSPVLGGPGLEERTNQWQRTPTKARAARVRCESTGDQRTVGRVGAAAHENFRHFIGQNPQLMRCSAAIPKYRTFHEAGAGIRLALQRGAGGVVEPEVARVSHPTYGPIQGRHARSATRYHRVGRSGEVTRGHADLRCGVRTRPPNNEMQLTRPVQIAASQLISSVVPTWGRSTKWQPTRAPHGARCRTR